MTATLASERPEGGPSGDVPVFSIVCLSRQDWATRLPTNRQQIMSRAAARGHEVVFVETGHFVGSRAARWLKGQDPGFLRRLVGFERLERRLSVRRAWNILPWGQRFRLSAAVNRRLTALSVSRRIRRLPRPVALWVYDPVAFSRPGEYGEDLAVYDVVDDYAEQAGERRRKLVADADLRAARSARVVFATTKTLHERHARNNPKTHLVRNVGDFAHFAPAADRDFVDPELASLRRPVLGFAGNLISSKVDFDLLDRLSVLLPETTLLLVGPADGAEQDLMTRLSERPNVRWLGFRPYAALPRYVAAFDVGLIPYVENAYTRSCFPLKLFEYLSAGKPVVATGLPELRGMEPDVVVAADADGMAAAVRAALDHSAPADRERRRAFAAQNTWETRTDRLLELVRDQLAGG
jgi:glycosyltransferase involved in cell wall biosynthesis